MVHPEGGHESQAMPGMLTAVPVILAGMYMVGLALLIMIMPVQARDFLGSFASSAGSHLAELAVRMIIGTALILHAPRMTFSGLFLLAGWSVVITTIALAALPWRWHRRFAQWSVPLATRHMTFLAFGSLAVGLAILLSVIVGAIPR